MSDPLVGSIVAGYRIVEPVGRGGMGVVYKAVELALDRVVALKVIAPELAADEAFRERFVAEARLAASLDHPNVVPIFGTGEDGACVFLAMRFVDGDDLATVVRRDGPLEPTRAARIIAHVAAGLEAAHRLGLVHRDVKPANILIGPDDHAYLADFGLAKHALAAGNTSTGDVVGTPDYLAPEQIRGAPVGPWTDVYALGCVLYFALTGAVAFPLPETAAKLWAQLSEPPPRAPAFDALVQAAMAKEPADRPGSAAAFESALRAEARREAEGRLEAAVDRASAGRREWQAAASELAGTVVALHEDRPSSGEQPRGVCPFKGLATFEFDDARYFFGRERVVAELVTRLVGSSLLGIVGASGSGKSSLLRAGLLPALAEGVLPGSERWRQVLLRPGEHPLSELDRADAGGDRVVLAVDQFEETFTACRDEAERAAFAAALLRHPHLVIVTIRGDYYERCAAYPELSRALAGNHVLVAPMRRDELRHAIERPATRAGLTVEPELVDALLADVEAEPGGLPLLSTALLELWQHRHGQALRLATYEQTGGVRRAVARLAEEAFEALAPDDQPRARRLLLLLAGEGMSDTVVRQRVPLAQLSEPLQQVAATLAERRLLTISAGTVEVAHEALLREWPRLRGWLEQDAEGRRLHLRLNRAAGDWHDRGRDAGDLFRGVSLAATLDWQRSHDVELTAIEHEFLDAACDAEERQLHEARRRTRRLRALAGSLAALALLTGISAVLAIRQSERAQSERRTAVSRSLATQTTAKLDDDPDVAALLSLEAYRTEPTFEARSAVLSVLPRVFRQARVLRGHSAPIAALQFRGNGTTIITGGRDGTVRTWDSRNGRPTGRIPLPTDSPIRSMAVSTDGIWLAASLDMGTIAVRDLRRSGDDANTALGSFDRAVSAAALSPDGRLLAGGTADGGVRFFDMQTRRELPLRYGVTPAPVVEAVAFSPDSRTLLVGDEAGALEAWDAATRAPRAPKLLTGRVRITALAFDPGGRVLASADAGGFVRLWDTSDWHPLGRPLPAGVGAVEALAFSPDGKAVAVAGETGIRLWDPGSRRELGQPLLGHTGAVTAVAFRADGALASAGADGTVRIWNVDDDASALTGHRGAVLSLDFNRDGTALASGGVDGTVRVWDPLTRRARDAPRRASGRVQGVAFAADGGLATVTVKGDLAFWDGATATRHATDVGTVFAVASDERSHRLIVGGDAAAATWDTRARRETGMLGGHGENWVLGVAVDPSGALLATAATDSTARLWEARTRRPHGLPLTGHTLPVRDVTFSPDGRTVATAGEDGAVRLWDTRTGRALGQPLQGHRTAVNGVAFSPDGATLASGDEAGAIQLWDVATRRALGEPLIAHRRPVTAVAFSPDGKLLASAGGDGTIRLWSSILWSDDLQAFRRRICAVIGRSLTAGEWHEFLPGQERRATCP